MFAWLRSGFVFAALGGTILLPATADAQWFGWGWGWDEPAWTSYYPGSYGGGYSGGGYYSGGYGAYYAPGGCGCDPCGCAPCGCDPCGCNPCGSACGTGGCSGGNCAGGNCAYDAPANGAPVPDPNVDAPPVRPRTTPNSTTPRTSPRTTPRGVDDAPEFEAPARGVDPMEPRARPGATDPLDNPQPYPRRPTREPIDPGTGAVDPFDASNPDAPRGGTGTRSPGLRDNSTAPASGIDRRPGNTFDPLDPATDKSFGTQKPELPADGESTIRQRKPAETPAVDDGTGQDNVTPRLELKATSAPFVPKARLATLSRPTTASRTVAKPAVRDWSAAMSEPRWLR
jgi:hypothetical protein